MVRETRRVWIAVLACALMALLPAASARATIYTVTPGAADVPDPTPNDGICDSGGGVCTLRGAVQTANGNGAPGFDTIEVPFDMTFFSHTLTIDNTAGDEDLAAQGDLDLTTNMEIRGTGGTPTITGQTPTADDRIFEIPSGNPTITIRNLVITKGQAPSAAHGGGIRHDSGALTIANSSVTDNDVPGDGARGGGIYSDGGSSLTLTDVNVNANTAGNFGSFGGALGGGIYTTTPVAFTRVAIYSNDASFGCGTAGCGGLGGGLYGGGGTLTNVTVSTNIAGGHSTMNGVGGGGGIYHGGDPMTLINSTVANNFALGNGFGLGGGNLVTSGPLNLQSTIVADGQTPDRPGSGAENCAVDNPGFVSLGHNLEARTGQGASQCGLTPGVNGDLTSTNAGLDFLDFYGGSTPTHRLQPSSPAIDAGALSGPVTDQRGVSRPQGLRCDIGAFELEKTGAVPGSTCAGPPVTTPPGTGTAPSNASPAPRKPRKCKKRKKKKPAAAVKKCKKRRT